MAESKGEIKIRKLLEDGDIIFTQEFSFPDLKSINGNPLRFDFALFETPEDLEAGRPKMLIEYQGEQHYERKFQTAEQFAKQQANDKKKVHYCNAKRLNLVTIPYTDFYVMTLDSILEQGKFFD